MPEVTIPDACIFCGNDDLTDEHYFPRKWVARISGLRGERLTMRHTRGTEAEQLGPDDEFDRWWKAREADLYVKCVCSDCNSGWMNVMDNDTYPILDPLVLGQRHRFGSFEEQTQLAAWLTKVALMADFKQLPATVPSSVQKSFYKTKRAPVEARIWIAAAQRDAEFRASAFTWALADGPVYELFLAIIRVQHFVGVFALPLVAKEIGGNRSHYRDAMRPIWPVSVETLDWPLPMLDPFDYIGFCNSFVASYKRFGL